MRNYRYPSCAIGQLIVTEPITLNELATRGFIVTPLSRASCQFNFGIFDGYSPTSFCATVELSARPKLRFHGQRSGLGDMSSMFLSLSLAYPENEVEEHQQGLHAGHRGDGLQPFAHLGYLLRALCPASCADNNGHPRSGLALQRYYALAALTLATRSICNRIASNTYVLRAWLLPLQPVHARYPGAP